MWRHLNGIVRLLIVGTVVLNMHRSNGTDPSSTANDNPPASFMTTHDANRQWLRLDAQQPPSANHATKPSQANDVGGAADKRCCSPTDGTDHPSNELAFSRETATDDVLSFAEKSPSGRASLADAQMFAGLRRRSARSHRLLKRPHVAPGDDDINDTDDDDAVTVEDDADGMQNEQQATAAALRSAGGGSQHYYGAMRRQPPATPAQQPTVNHQYRPDDYHVEYTREVHIKQGRLRGMVRSMHAQSGLRNVNQYLGIPYAAAPIGNGRFMPPGAPPQWHGSKVFTQLSAVCPQQLPQINGSNAGQIASGRYDQLKRLLPFLRHEDEDCLFLNLYAPQIAAHDDKATKLPVIVFVHGESYEWNSGNPYDGSVLASYGQVVVVTLNYRLGILGFLKPSMGEPSVSNFGLLDQIAALQWVKDNIAAFGGNNGAVTLMGHGTGAACVNLLMLSPVARGLFHRAILMSGSALSDWALAKHPLPTTMQVVQGINCPLHDDSEEILQCLRKKRYQEILQQRVQMAEYATVFGPVVDNLVIPNEPHVLMSQYNEMFSRYDLLFGMTEIESYHNLNAVALSHGLRESERDSYLRQYMQNRYEQRPDIAMALTLQEYNDLYTNPKRPLAGEHRDTVLEILSDARVIAPLLQTGLFHSKVNPRSYMYVFGHNSRAGEYANLPQSIAGEDLPYVFGAPLASTTPFPSKYSPEERLLSESIMTFWTNFAKTGNPKAPSRDHYINLYPKDWSRYDIDWPEFSGLNMNYLNIGMPPVVNQKYRQKYMVYWNHVLPDEMNRTLSLVSSIDRYAQPSIRAPLPTHGSWNSGQAHIQYYPDRTTDDPLRTLKLLLNRPQQSDHNEMYNTQSTAVTATIIDNGEPFNNDQHANVQTMPDNQIVVKADATLSILITILVSFILLNGIVIVAFLVRRHYAAKSLQHKQNADGTAGDAAKRCAGDVEDSYTLDAAARMRHFKAHSNDYETVAAGGGGSPFMMSTDLANGQMDAHTKVTDWMCQEIRNGDLKKNKPGASTSFSLKGRGFFRRCTKTPESTPAADPDAQSDNPMKSFDTIICQDVDVDTSLIDGSIDLRDSQGRRSSIPSLNGKSQRIDHRHSRSDPVQMYYRRAPAPDEDITFFIEDPSMSSTRADSVERTPLSPDEALQTIRLRNYPKVLPRVPDDNTEYVSSSLIKRRSLPPQYFSVNPAVRMPPAPPPRTTSTLGRTAKRESHMITTSPLMLAEEPPAPDPEPVITCNILHVGPLLPKSTESIYSTVTRTPRSPLRSASAASQFSFENCITIETPTGNDGATVAVHRPSGLRPPSGQRSTENLMLTKVTPPKVVMRPKLLRQQSGDSLMHHRMSVRSIPEEPTVDDVAASSTSTLAADTASEARAGCKSVEQAQPSSDNPPVTGKVISSRIPQLKHTHADRSESESSTSSSATKSSSSGAETVKQVF